MLSSISTSMHTRPGPAGRYRATRGDARRFVGGCTHSCLLSPVASENVALFMELTRVKRRVASGSAAYRAGESFESLLVVVSGSFKTARVSEAGEEKVTGFYFPGDTLGLNAVSDNRHVDEAIALEDSTVCAVPYSMLTDSARRVPQLHVGLLRAMSSEIVRDDGLVYLAETLTAEQRVFAFLLAMSHRYAKMGCDPERFLLRMSRRDVASYLGLSNETVSRVLTKARRDGLLWVREREIELKDIEAMSEIVGEW